MARTLPLVLLLAMLAPRAWAEAPSVLPAASPSAAGAAAAGPARTVVVRVSSPDSRVVIERVEQRPGFLRLDECPGACGRALDADARYRVSGPGVTPSPLFSLPSDRPDVTLHVRPGSATRFGVGVRLIAYGILALAAGAVTTLATLDGSPEGLHAAGLIASGAGLLSISGGGTLCLTARTKVSFR